MSERPVITLSEIKAPNGHKTDGLTIAKKCVPDTRGLLRCNDDIHHSTLNGAPTLGDKANFKKTYAGMTASPKDQVMVA